MSTLDLNNYAPPPVETQAQQAAPVPSPTQEPSTAAATQTDTPSSQTSTVTIMGPLSSIYAQALMNVYAKDNIAVECNVTEIATILTVQNQQTAEQPESSIIYATDQDALDNDPTGEFEKLHLALDQKKQGYVAIENMRNPTSKTAIIMNYASENAKRTFYSRDSFVRHFKK